MSVRGKVKSVGQGGGEGWEMELQGSPSILLPFSLEVCGRVVTGGLQNKP